MPQPKKAKSSQKAAAAEGFEFSAIEKEILSEINILRTRPKVYIKLLEEQRKYFKGNVLALPNQVPIVTNEGIAAVDEAIGELKKRPEAAADPADKLKSLDEAIGELRNFKPANSLLPSPGLTKAARLHLKDMIDNDFFGHTGSNRSTPEQRMLRFVFASTAGIKENITWGAKSARDIVLMMVIDDGFASRGHRKNVLNTGLKHAGAAFGIDRSGMGICVVGFAADVVEKTAGQPILIK